MHDIGNVINRCDHAQSGAIMAFRILDKMGMPVEDIALVITAIGNHDEGTAFPVNAVAAADVYKRQVVAAFIAKDPDSSVFQIVSFAWAGFCLLYTSRCV